MANLSSTKAAADGLLTSLAAQIASPQASYQPPHGNYWQGLKIHSSIPADGTASAADALTSHPSDVDESWQDINGSVYALLNASFAFTVLCDVYMTPSGGRGYILRALLVWSGDTHIVSVNYGPETWRSHDWKVQVNA